jgi:hypothetical protein
MELGDCCSSWGLMNEYTQGHVIFVGRGMWNSVLFLSGIVSVCFVLFSVMLMAFNSKLNIALKH